MEKETMVHLFHIIIIGGLFLYVGTMRDSVPKMMFPFLLLLGVIIIFYHSYKVYNYITQGKGYWVNLIHIFFVGPLLIYIGFNREKTQRSFFELLLMAGFAAIGYHSYYMIPKA
jgi:lipoprotein signal peptidase